MAAQSGNPSDALQVRTIKVRTKGPASVRYEWRCPVCHETYWTALSRRTETCSQECAGKLRHDRTPTGLTPKERAARDRAIARAFVAEINTRTYCAHCGAQPIDWHNPDHVELNRQNYRISRMVGIGRSPAKIQEEMDACTPLCRRCHMAEDGRQKKAAEVFANYWLTRPAPAPRACATCGALSTSICRNLCPSCYRKKRYYTKTEDGQNRGTIQNRVQTARMKAAPQWRSCTQCQRQDWRIVKGLCDACDNKRRYRIRREKELANPRPSRRPRGERIQGAKLTEQEVRSIRIRYDCGEATRNQLAKEYGVDVTSIRSIVLRLSWTHVT